MKELTKRTVLYIGYNCNAKCIHCYFSFKKGDWRPIEICKKEAFEFREKYGNEFVDITGGEPSVYPNIVELIKYCSDINLKPTIITNGIVMKKRAKEFKTAGLNDCLVSVHGTKDTAEKIYGFSNMWIRLTEGIVAIRDNFSTWRSNTTILKQNYKDLPSIAEFLINNKVSVANFIAFNPYHEWKKITNIECQVQFKEIEKHLIEAIDMLQKENIKVNVRYYPFCMLKGYEKNVVNWLQLSYDKHEWDLNSWLDQWWHWDKGITKDEMAIKVREKECIKGSPCNNCKLNAICDGLSKQYAKRYGFNELRSY